MATYKSSQGSRYSTAQIDRLIRKAKEIKIANMKLEYGFVFCEQEGCGRSAGIPLDCSHKVSVKEAKESGRVELCWDLHNIEILCRDHHKERDGLNLQFNNE